MLVSFARLVMGAFAHLFATRQTALQPTVYWTADGLILVRALKLVKEGFRAEVAAILCLQMAAKLV